jgi:4a-hydroxytetrahydrobiopterin dehydratase
MNKQTVTPAEMSELISNVPQWQVVEESGVKQLKRLFKFKNFVQAMAFANQVGQIAEEEDHHPKLVIEWGKVIVVWWTHEAGGLQRRDFDMAARTDRRYEPDTA